MFRLNLGIDTGRVCRILCIGAHCDDIEIGCGGTLLTLMETHPNIACHWVVLCSNAERECECLKSAERFLAGAKEREVVVRRFRDGYLPFIGAEIKDYFETLKTECWPDIIFTHYHNDLHQDHRLISSLTWNTFRDHLILEYEIPKYDGDFGSPNCFVHLDEARCRRKVESLVENYQTQNSRHWFCAETFWAILRVRGLEAGSPSGYAEGFYARKIVL